MILTAAIGKEEHMLDSPIDPNRSILPILRFDPGDRVTSVVGTGFIVGDPPLS